MVWKERVCYLSNVCVSVMLAMRVYLHVYASYESVSVYAS